MDNRIIFIGSCVCSWLLVCAEPRLLAQSPAAAAPLISVPGAGAGLQVQVLVVFVEDAVDDGQGEAVLVGAAGGVRGLLGPALGQGELGLHHGLEDGGDEALELHVDRAQAVRAEGLSW